MSSIEKAARKSRFLKS